MKRTCQILVAVALTCGIALPVYAQERQGAGRRGGGSPPQGPTITTLAGDVRADWDAMKALIVDLADAMPADKFGYKATAAQRNYGDQVMHIVQANGFLLQTLKGKTAAPTINMEAKTKDEIMTALRASFDYGAAVVKEFNDQQFVERVAPPPFMGPSASRIRLIYGLLQHTQDIYGQMVVYVRLNGIVPPPAAAAACSHPELVGSV